MSLLMKRRDSPARHMTTWRERWSGRLAKAVCRLVGHDEFNRFTGDTICNRCRVVLGRWR